MESNLKKVLIRRETIKRGDNTCYTEGVKEVQFSRPLDCTDILYRVHMDCKDKLVRSFRLIIPRSLKFSSKSSSYEVFGGYIIVILSIILMYFIVL